MIEEIKKKIDNSIQLTIDELKILYEIDYESDEDLNPYREKRDQYNDLVSIFGSDKVANDVKDITVNTLCYVGNLYLVNFVLKQVPSYNLRYIYGDLSDANISSYFYWDGKNNKYENLDNLEVVFGNVTLRRVDNLKSFENLSRVNSLEFDHIDSLKEELPYRINSLIINNETYPNLNLPTELYKIKIVNAKKDSKGQIIFNENLKIAEFDKLDYVRRIFHEDLLPDNLKELYLPNVMKIYNHENATIPSNLEILDLSSLINGYGINLPASLKILSLNSIRNKNQLPRLDHLVNLEELNISSISNLEGVLLPPNLKKLHVNNLCKIDYPKSLEELYVSSSTKDIIEKKLPEGIKLFSAGSIRGIIFPKSLEELILNNNMNNGKLTDYTFKDLKRISLINITYINKVVFPKDMDELYFRDINKMVNCKLPDTCESLTMLDLRRTDTLVLPRVLGKGVFIKLKNVNRLIFSEQVKNYVKMPELNSLNNQKIPFSLKDKIILQRPITDKMLISDEEYKEKVKSFRK